VLLKKVHVQRFRNIVDSGWVDIEPDVTALVGKNESGKSTLLHSLFRLNPANAGYRKRFDATEEYPRWRMTTDRRAGDLAHVKPITAVFEVEDGELAGLAQALGVPSLPKGTTVQSSRSYGNNWTVSLRLTAEQAVRAAADAIGVQADDIADLTGDSLADIGKAAKEAAAGLEEKGETARAAALKKLPNQIKSYEQLVAGPLTQEQIDALAGRLPKFFYFSNYATLPGDINLTDLLAKVQADADLTAPEQTAAALLRFAGVTGEEFVDNTMESRKAELEAAAIELTRQVFEYWKQNTDLSVDFYDDPREVDRDPQDRPIIHRFLNVRLKDNRHGGVTTNFSTRSSGFQWFFSFLAAFNEYETSNDRVIVLLDEPGTSLHGEAQQDFLRFINERLGAKQQVIYTTHSQHMIDPAAYEKLRAVEDRSTRENPDAGAVVTPVRLSGDRDTLLPIQAALGYSINQHLFIGAQRHLVVEGGADYVYLAEMSAHLAETGRKSLDPRLAILPVGGADKIPAFVALLGRHLEVSVLLDGGNNSRHVQRLQSLITDGIFDSSELVLCSQIDGTHSSADIEDMFEPQDYVRLVGWSSLGPLSVGDLPTSGDRMVNRVATALGVGTLITGSRPQNSRRTGKSSSVPSPLRRSTGSRASSNCSTAPSPNRRSHHAEASHPCFSQISDHWSGYAASGSPTSARYPDCLASAAAATASSPFSK